MQTLRPPRPSAAALDAEFTALVEQIPGMRIIDPTITDNGGRMVCATWTGIAARTPKPHCWATIAFTPAEAHAFVIDAEQVYCPSHIRQTIG